MKILTIENTCLNLETLPDQLEDDIRFAVLDNSNILEPDFYFPSLIFLESFSSPAIVLDIGGHTINMPIDWSIVVGCSETGSDLEVLPLTSINDRYFEAFIYNPLTGFKTEFVQVQIVNFYADVKWYFPKVQNNQIIAFPLWEGSDPLCAYFVKDVNKQSEIINYFALF